MTWVVAVVSAWVGFLLGFLCCAWFSVGRKPEEPRK